VAIGPHPPNEEITEQHLMFGIVTINGVSRPVLQKQATEEDACTACRGYGHGGNPLCGGVYMCKECDGSGLRQPGQPPFVPESKSAEHPIDVCPGTPGWWWLALGLGLTIVVILLTMVTK
jgi:hypothetical protein